MSHLLPLTLCLAGFSALAFAMRRHQRDIVGRPLGMNTTRVLRFVGSCALLLALGTLVAWQGCSLGLVMFSGHTSVAAALVYCMIVGYAGIHARPMRDARQGGPG